MVDTSLKQIAAQLGLAALAMAALEGCGQSSTSSEAPPSTVTAAAPAPAVANAQAEADARLAAGRAFIGRLGEAEALCSSNGKQMIAALERGDMVAGYEAATATARACREASDEIKKVELPSYLKDSPRDFVVQGVAKMSESLSVQGLADDSFAAYANGDQRPSTIVAARQAMQQSSEEFSTGQAMMLAGFDKAGVPVAAQMEAEDKAASKK